ncbi:MAG: DUF5752 family protein [Elusimicrobiota bacterium]|nr:DUF5752 family protein [Elusimicrobiota bacterium]
MNAFVFYSCANIPRYTGVKAATMDEFYDGIKNSGMETIFYHIYYSLYKRHVSQIDYMNDFAEWLWKTAGAQDIAERISVFDPAKIKSLSRTKTLILKILEKHKSEVRDFARVARGKEFYFMGLLTFVAKSGIVAENEKEFFEGVKQSSVESVFYHLVGSRLRLKKVSNDFSEWLSVSCGRDDLAERINRLNLHQYNLRQIKDKIEEIGLDA